MNLSQFETAAPPFSSRAETALALAVLPLAFLHILLASLFGSRAIPGQPWLYILLLALFSAIALCSVLFLAAPGGERLIRRLLVKNRLLALATLPVVYVGGYLLLLWVLRLPQLSSHALAGIRAPWTQLPTLLFLAIAGLLLIAGFYGGLRLAIHYANAANIPRSFGWRQMGCVLLATLPYLVLQQQLPLLWCFSTPVAVTVMIYATGLGREYFYFSFAPRSLSECRWIFLLLLAGLCIFLLIALVSPNISYTGNFWRTPWTNQYNAAFMWLFIVGVSEEVLFRCGLLLLFASHLERWTKTNGAYFWSRYPRLSAMLLTSFLFGIAHLYRGFPFAFLAFIASLLYGLAFVAGKSLAGPVLLHGLLNVLIMRNFQL